MSLCSITLPNVTRYLDLAFVLLVLLSVNVSYSYDLESWRGEEDGC